MKGVLLAAIATVLLAGCGGELQTPGEALRIFSAQLPQAFSGEQYEAPIRAVGGLRPFNYRLSDGELPPGLTLRNGTIRGVPLEVGRFVFTVTVSDANLSSTFEEYSLTVAERPPPTVRLIAPQTEIREPTTVRLQLEDASRVRVLSARLTWDKEVLELSRDSVTAAGSGSALLWESGPGWLQLDVAALGAAWNDNRSVASFVLEPSRPTTLTPTMTVLFLDDRGGRHFQGENAAAGAADPSDSEAEAGAGQENEVDDPLEIDATEEVPEGQEP